MVYIQCIDELRPVFAGFNLVNDISYLEYDYWVPICSLATYFNFIPNGKYIFHQESKYEGDIGIVWHLHKQR